MVNIADLSQHFAVFGIKPTNILLVDIDGKAYDLNRIPKVKNHYVGVRDKDGKTVVAFVHISSLEEATNPLPHNRNGHGLSHVSFIDERTTIGQQDIQRWVNLAHGFQTPQQQDFYDHPFPSTTYSETSDM